MLLNVTSLLFLSDVCCTVHCKTVPCSLLRQCCTRSCVLCSNSYRTRRLRLATFKRLCQRFSQRREPLSSKCLPFLAVIITFRLSAAALAQTKGKAISTVALVIAIVMARGRHFLCAATAVVPHKNEYRQGDI